jgi:predicted nucleic acid-binding protein
VLDTSALATLVVDEPGSTALREGLRVDVVPAASALVRTELRRAARRLDPSLLPAADAVIARLHLLRVDDDVLDLAGRLDPAALWSLDALHVATALRAGADVLVTYDTRMATAAAEAGLVTAAP